LAAWRILRCNPFTKGGVDEVKPGNGRYSVTAKGFVVPRVLIAKEGK
jgi:putative component of membrane protein insertase Oxa1/YidC/SpoIIIJ protein YidD